MVCRLQEVRLGPASLWNHFRCEFCGLCSPLPGVVGFSPFPLRYGPSIDNQRQEHQASDQILAQGWSIDPVLLRRGCLAVRIYERFWLYLTYPLWSFPRLRLLSSGECEAGERRGIHCCTNKGENDSSN